MNCAIIYHSESGNTAEFAQTVAEGIKAVKSCEVKVFSVESVDKEWVTGSQLVLFGCPIYAGNCSWQMKKFFDTTDISLAGKLGGVFATENHFGGGADLGEMSMIAAMLVRGMLIYSAGTSKGLPYTHFGAIALKNGTDEQRQRAKIFGTRLAEKAIEIFAVVA